MKKAEFETILLLYAARIDGNLHPEEMEQIIEKSSPETFRKVKKVFDKMGDIEIIEYIRENKILYASTEIDRKNLINDIRSVIEADERLTVMERYLCQKIEKILNS